MSESSKSPSIADYVPVLHRGQEPSYFYPVAVYAKCWQCGEWRHIDLEDGRCAGCATTNEERN